jgi:transglutaminase-like putative cysteine protease/lipoprotein NlpI
MSKQRWWPGAHGVIRTVLWSLWGLMALPALAQQDQKPQAQQEVQLASDRFVRAAPAPTWATPVTELPRTQRKNPLVFLMGDTQFMSGAEKSSFLHRAWQINDASALAQFAQYGIGFQPNYQQLQLHWLRIRRSGQVLDQTQTAQIRFLQRENQLEQGVYSGEVTASILIADLRVGDVLEIAYSWVGNNPVFQGRFSDFAGWDYSVPTEWRRVSYTHPVNRPVQWRMLGELGRKVPTPVESVTNGLRKLVWEERGLEPLLPEDFIPDSFFAARTLQISEYSNWEEVADWATQLFQNREPLTGELQAVVQRLRALPTVEQRISAALSWVQTEIRYFSVSLGESSHRPHSPNQTLARRYGDCKDKSFLLIELLRALDVPAQPVLLSNRAPTTPGKMLPSPHAFDHVIVRVQLGAQAYFLDPTLSEQRGKLDRLGPTHEGSLVLVAAPGNRALSAVAYPNFAALQRNELRETIKLPSFGGEGTLQARQTWNGLAAEYMRSVVAQLSPEQFGKALMEPYENRYPGIYQAERLTVEDDTDNNVLITTATYRIPKLAIPNQGDWGIRFGAANMRNTMRLPPSAQRNLPMALATLPRTIVYELSVEFPPEAAVITDPTTSRVSNPAFDYTISYTFRGNRATASISLRTLKSEIPAGDIAAYMAALRRIDEVTRSYFVVRKNEIKATGLLGLGSKTLQQSLKDRVYEGIGRLDKAIESSKLTGEDLAGAYCLRASARLDVEDAVEGMKDAQQAVKIAPNFAESYHCRAQAWFFQGDYVRSAADYTRAIALGDAGFGNYYRRGHSRFYAGQLEAALADFNRAHDISASSGEESDSDNTLYAELWRVWTQKRLGLTPGEAQRKFAAEKPDGAWPRPALAMLHGQLSVEAVLQYIERHKKGDDKVMALAEAYFYIGQHYYAQNDKLRAIDYFKKARAQGITMFIEHVAAGAELKLLGVVTE